LVHHPATNTRPISKKSVLQEETNTCISYAGIFVCACYS
jgi:hypothetical protein